MHLSFGFDIGVQEVNLPDFNYMASLNPGAIPEISDTEQEFRRALGEPIGSNRLRELAHTGSKVAILTEPSFPNAEVLPAILDELYTGGVSKSDITLILASPDGRHYTSEERKELCGPRAANEVRIINHDVNRTAVIGYDADGKKVKLAKVAAEADLRVLLGKIGYHPVLGTTGGYDALLPRCGARSLPTSVLKQQNEPCCRAGEVNENPFRKAIEEIAPLAGACFLFALVTDEMGNLIRSVAGDPIEAHRNGCLHLNAYCMKKLPLSADVVLCAAGGAEHDASSATLLTALDAAANAVRPGGTIVMIASCKDGFSESSLPELATNAGSPERLLAFVHNAYNRSATDARILANAAKKARLLLVSSLPDEVAGNLFFEPFRNAQSALDDALEKDPAARVLAMPYGTLTLPVVTGE